ncbi:MAG: hypothetical protein M3O67_03680, partial [Bacteroidota bacterium]|nr:hypothetical protein [Bacteroidota bacterium]
EAVLHHFVSDINIEAIDDNEIVADMMDVADAFVSMSQDEQLNALLKQELKTSLEKSEQANSFHGFRIFYILNQAYEAVVEKNVTNVLPNFADYENLKISQLKNKNETINEVVLFYGDDDGKASFKSFTSLFKDTTQWKVETNTAWISIMSVQGEPFAIYANQPLDNENKIDLLVQDSLFMYLKDQGINPAIIVHRGHSYHLSNTLKRLDSTTRLAILGSCGGYTNMQKIVEANPNIQIIASKQVGSMMINDPLLNFINNQVKGGIDLNWDEVWTSLKIKFKDDTMASKLFGEYIPPYKNVGVFVFKLYNAD